MWHNMPYLYISWPHPDEPDERRPDETVEGVIKSTAPHFSARMMVKEYVNPARPEMIACAGIPALRIWR